MLKKLKDFFRKAYHWILSVIGIMFLIFISTTQFIPVGLGTSNWTIVGNKVLINDSRIYLSAEPYTIHGSGFVDLELMSKLYSGDATIVFGFNTTRTKPTGFEIYHPVNITTEYNYSCDYNFNYTLTPKYAWCYQTLNQTDNISTTHYNVTIFEHNFSIGNLITKTIYWNETEQIDYIPSLIRSDIIEYDFGGMTSWRYIENVSIIQNNKYKARIYLDVPKTLYGWGGKYWFCVMPSSYGKDVRQANLDDELYCLDPWFTTETLFNITLLHSSFENEVTDNFSTTGFSRTTAQYKDGSASATLPASSSANRVLTSNSVDSSLNGLNMCSGVYVSFWTMDDDIDDADNVWFQIKNSSGTYINYGTELGLLTEDTWVNQLIKVNDSSFLYSDFQVRFTNGGALASTENLWVDNVTIICLDPWWNTSYTYKRGINCTNLTDGVQIVINGSSGFNLSDCVVNQIVWTMCQGANTSLYYTNCTDYVVANDTTLIPFEVEVGTGTSYKVDTLWKNGSYNYTRVFHLNNSGYDSSYTLNGTLKGTPVFTTDGIIGGGMLFDGVNDAVNMNIPFGSGENDYKTGSVIHFIRVRRNGTGDTYDKVRPLMGETIGAYLWAYGINDHPSFVWRKYHYFNVLEAAIITTAVFSYDVPAMLVTTWNNATGERQYIYLNSTVQSNTTGYTQSADDGRVNYSIGVGYGPALYFNGTMGEVRTSNQQIHYSVISQIYSNYLYTKGYGEIGIEESQAAGTGSCTYVSGNWAINCTDHCNITATNLLLNNFTIIGASASEERVIGLSNITNYSFGRIENCYVYS